MRMSKNFQLKAKDFVIELPQGADPWNDDWNILSTYDGEHMGQVNFAGEKALGTVPVSLELTEKYQNKGYGTEIFRMMVSWAFSHSSVYEVKAVCDHDNDKAVFSLEKAGFVYRSKEMGVETYSVVKPKTSWLGLYLIIGFNIGLVLAIVINTSPWVGFIVGMFIGIAIGTIMDQKEKKKRERITGRKTD